MSEQEVDAFLEHYGIKGMKWGVRKEQDSEPRIAGNKAFIAKRTAQNLTVVGATQAGRILGAAGGTAVAGLGAGTFVGGLAGGTIGAHASSRLVYGNVKKKKEAAKANLPGLLPQRNSKYSPSAAKSDIDRWGPDSAQRINRSMNNGLDYKTAQKQEGRLQRNALLVSIGATYAQKRVINKVGPTVGMLANGSAYNVASKMGAGRAARKSPNMKIGPALSFTSPSRDGVYNLTTLK